MKIYSSVTKNNFNICQEHSPLLVFRLVYKYICAKANVEKYFWSYSNTLCNYISRIECFIDFCISNIWVYQAGLLFMDLVRQLRLSPQWGESAKEFANIWFFSVWDIKRQFYRYSRSGNFQISNSLFNWQNLAVFLIKIFLKALFWSFCIFFWLVIAETN